jgi:hypothetical protein
MSAHVPLFGFMRRAIWRAYSAYDQHFPIARGKYRVGHALGRAVGLAEFEFDGLRLELRMDGTLDRKLLRGETHDPVVLDQIRTQLRDGGVFLDVGANIGYFTLQAARIRACV